MGSAKASKPASRSCGKTHVSMRQALPGRAVLDREARHAEHVEPRRDRDRLPPVREAPAVAEVGLLDQQAVRDHLVVGGRGDHELAGGLVVRVIDDRQPLPRLVRPVVAEERAVAVLVGADQEAAGGHAVVAHHDLPPLAARAGAGSRWIREPVPACSKRSGAPASVTALDRHACPAGRGRAARGRGRSRDAALEDAEADRGLALDRVGRVGQRQAERVVEDVDPRLARVGVGARGAGRRPGSRERRARGERAVGRRAWAIAYMSEQSPRLE